MLKFKTYLNENRPFTRNLKSLTAVSLIKKNVYTLARILSHMLLKKSFDFNNIIINSAVVVFGFSYRHLWIGNKTEKKLTHMFAILLKSDAKKNETFDQIRTFVRLC